MISPREFLIGCVLMSGWSSVSDIPGRQRTERAKNAIATADEVLKLLAADSPPVTCGDCDQPLADRLTVAGHPAYCDTCDRAQCWRCGGRKALATVDGGTAVCPECDDRQASPEGWQEG